MFDFDRVIERRGTHSSNGITSRVFRASSRQTRSRCGWRTWISPRRPASRKRSLPRLQCAVHGYYADTGKLGGRTRRLDGAPPWRAIDPAWVSPTPGIVSGLGLILQAVSAPGDEVVVFPPAYHAFRRIILANERRILDAQLVESAGRYVMDLDALRAQAVAANESRFPLQPAQSRRHSLVGRRASRAGRLMRRTRSDPGVRRDPLRSRLRRRESTRRRWLPRRRSPIV